MYIMVDVETAGFQSPAQKNSYMPEFAAICIDPDKWRKGLPLRAFHGIFDNYDLAVERYPEAQFKDTEDCQMRLLEKNNLLIDVVLCDYLCIMEEFRDWIEEFGGKRPMFISDNNGFDYSWMSFYLWKYLNENPFGHSSTNLGSLYKGLDKNVYKNFKHLRKTKHDHNPVNDCLGNVEAFMKMVDEMGLKI